MFASFTGVCSTLFWPDRWQRGVDRLNAPVRFSVPSLASTAAYLRSLSLWSTGVPSPVVLLRELAWLSALDEVDWEEVRLPDPLFLVAASDQVLPACWQRRSAQMTSARVHEVPGGHGFFIEDPVSLLQSLSGR
jgi:hypothetical protein